MSQNPSVEELEQALRQAPGNAPVRYLLGATLASAGEYERAAEEMSVALRLQPDLHTARFQLGLLYVTMGQTQQAAEVWEMLEQLPPDSPLKLFKRGIEALIRDDFMQCIALLEQGIKGNKENEPLNRDMTMVIESAVRAMANSGDASTAEPLGVRTDFSLYDQ